jgi:hypothetical protein
MLLSFFSAIERKLLVDRADYLVVNCGNNPMKRTGRQLEGNMGRYDGGEA